jgi:hypothetical protein
MCAYGLLARSQFRRRFALDLEDMIEIEGCDLYDWRNNN